METSFEANFDYYLTRLLRDVSSWGGEARDWERVVREAELRVRLLLFIRAL